MTLLKLLTGFAEGGLLAWFFCWVGFKKVKFPVTPWNVFVATGLASGCVLVPFLLVAGFLHSEWWALLGAAVVNTPLVVYWWCYLKRRNAVMNRTIRELFKAEMPWLRRK